MTRDRTNRPALLTALLLGAVLTCAVLKISPGLSHSGS